jgi:hypothetical protein
VTGHGTFDPAIHHGVEVHSETMFSWLRLFLYRDEGCRPCGNAGYTMTLKEAERSVRSWRKQYSDAEIGVTTQPVGHLPWQLIPFEPKHMLSQAKFPESTAGNGITDQTLFYHILADRFQNRETLNQHWIQEVNGWLASIGAVPLGG